MKKNLRRTPNSIIKNALRRLWLHSRERRAAIKDQDHRCQRCGTRESRAKYNEVFIEVHHKKGVGNWDRVMAVIREELLVDPSMLEVLCVPCHDKEHGDKRKKKAKHRGIDWSGVISARRSGKVGV